MKIVFWGSSEFAVLALEALKRAGFDIGLVITQPDAPQGRHLRLQACPVAKKAQELDLPLFQPERLKNEEIELKIRAQGAEVFVVAAYGRIIPQNLLDLAPKGTINIHPSLLPKYRGPSPIQSAILNGDTETGVSIMLLDKEMDHGPILAQEIVPLAPTTTAPELEKTLSALGAELLIKTLPEYLNGKIVAKEQDHSQATICKMLKKEDGKINWTEPAEVIERKIRALQPWPGTFTFYQENGKEQLLKIHKANVIDGVLKLEIVQPAGKTPMSFADFLKGHRELVGQIFSM